MAAAPDRKERIGKEYIGVGVGGVIVQDNKVLLLLRAKAPEKGKWSIPGGTVEIFETVEEALLREIKEELGVEGRIIASLGVTDHILPKEGVHWIAPRFLIGLHGEPMNREPDKHEAIQWWPLDDLPEKITQTTQKAIAAYNSLKH